MIYQANYQLTIMLFSHLLAKIDICSKTNDNILHSARHASFFLIIHIFV